MLSKVASAIRNESHRKKPAEAPLARIAISEEGLIAYASPEFCDLSHQPFERLHNTQAGELIAVIPPDGQKVIAVTALETGVHSVRINGHARPFQFHFDWLKTPDNRRYLVGSQATGHKTPRKALNRTLVDILSHHPPVPQQILTTGDYQQFFDLSGEALIVTGPSGLIEGCNATFLSLTGFNPDDLTARPIASLMEDGGQAQHAPGFEARIRTHRAGEFRWIDWRMTAANGKTYYAGRDITDIKAQQTELARREKQLSEAESIGRMGHWHWTIGQLDMQWSDEIYRIFGVEKGQFHPTLETMNKMVHRADIARLNQAFQRALIEENDYDMEFRILGANGDMRHIRCEGRCARDASGEVTALYGIMQDMTERMLYEAELRAAKDNAERAYAARTQFLANMSHELRTPLNAIIGFSEMIQHQLLGPIGNQKYLEYISGIRESGEHLLDLISDILDMSKIEAGKYELDLGEVPPGKLLNLAAHMMEGRAHEAGVKITLEGIDESVKIVADRRAVLQIVLNLLSNAVKFTNAGGEIKISMLQRENNVWVKVADNGIGIPANKLATITKPFEQVSSSYARDHQGTGLGLAITKELAEMHGGSLFIESALGKGTTVTVRLPLDAFKASKASK
jgi:two-component system, cell cycle sensor histidine kinase PleC